MPLPEKADSKTKRNDDVNRKGESKKDDSKISISIGSKRLSSSPTKEQTKVPKFEVKAKEKQEAVVAKTNKKVAAIFNNDDSDSEEEMPLECRMKMRNIGRDTITSAGPNSFNKGKKGFTNHSFKQFELSMKPRNSMEKKVSYEES